MAGVVCDDNVEAVRSDSQFVDRTVALFLLQDRRPNVEPPDPPLDPALAVSLGLAVPHH